MSGVTTLPYVLFYKFQLPSLDKPIDKINDILQTNLSSLVQQVCILGEKTYSSLYCSLFYITLKSRQVHKKIRNRKKAVKIWKGVCQEGHNCYLPDNFAHFTSRNWD